MTDEEKIARVKILLNDPSISDAKVAVYLDLAKTEIVNHLYSLYDEIPQNAILPVKFENKQCELATAMVGKAFAMANGGFTQHSESAGGTSVTDIYGDMASYGYSPWVSYLADVVPYARVYQKA